MSKRTTILALILAGFMSLGVNAHLTKPARASRLFETVVRVLQEKAGAQNAAAEPKQATQEPSSEPGAPEPKPSQKAESATPSSGLDVLVAEDNEVNRLVITHILKEAGVSFKIAHNGREALALYAEQQPSVILMDVSMPEMNGFEFAQAVRAKGTRNDEQRAEQADDLEPMLPCHC